MNKDETAFITTMFIILIIWICISSIIIFTVIANKSDEIKELIIERTK